MFHFQSIKSLSLAILGFSSLEKRISQTLLEENIDRIILQGNLAISSEAEKYC